MSCNVARVKRRAATRFYAEGLYVVAKFSKLPYDERVRKAFVFILSILIFAVLGYFPFPKAYAASLPPCAEWGVWNGIEYLSVGKDIKKYQNKDGTFRPGNKVNCIKFRTAIGEINPGPKAIVASIFNIVLGLAGGIALILIIISGYRFMASQGNPEELTNARQQLIAAIVGLLFIIFSFVILQVIGVEILKIPGFTR